MRRELSPTSLSEGFGSDLVPYAYPTCVIHWHVTLVRSRYEVSVKRGCNKTNTDVRIMSTTTRTAISYLILIRTQIELAQRSVQGPLRQDSMVVATSFKQLRQQQNLATMSIK